MALKNFEDLFLWQKAYQFTCDVYKSTIKFPKYELYGLQSQLRRSAHSVNSNISEGFHRSSTKEFIRFLFIAKGSLNESINHLLLAKGLEYIDEETFVRLRNQTESIGKILQSTINKLKIKIQ